MKQIGLKKPISNSLKQILTLAALCLFLFSCKKEISNNNNSVITQKTKVDLPLKTNPMSVRNLEKAKEALAKKGRTSMQRTLFQDSQFIYFRFNPANIPQETFEALENDSTVKLMDFPFGNGLCTLEKLN